METIFGSLILHISFIYMYKYIYGKHNAIKNISFPMRSRPVKRALVRIYVKLIFFSSRWNFSRSDLLLNDTVSKHRSIIWKKFLQNLLSSFVRTTIVKKTFLVRWWWYYNDWSVDSNDMTRSVFHFTRSNHSPKFYSQ